MIIYPHDPRYKFDIREDQPTDAVVIREIFCENVYETYDGDLSDTKIVVDIGANIGAYSVYAVSLNSEAKVYAVEPEPENLEQLAKTIQLNDLGKNIEIIPVAVGDADRNALISSSGGDSKISQEGSVIRMVTLEKLWKSLDLEYVDVLKIDVEGYERAIITAAPDELLILCRYIVIEYDRNANDGDFAAIVGKLSHTHQLKIVGSELTGGYIYAHRY